MSTIAFLQNKRGSRGWSNNHQLTLLAITGILAHDKARDAVCSLKVSLFTYFQAHPQPHVRAHTCTRARTNTHNDLLFSLSRRLERQAARETTHSCLTFGFVSTGGFSVVAEHLTIQILISVGSYCPC